MISISFNVVVVFVIPWLNNLLQAYFLCIMSGDLKCITWMTFLHPSIDKLCLTFN